MLINVLISLPKYSPVEPKNFPENQDQDHSHEDSALLHVRSHALQSHIHRQHTFVVGTIRVLRSGVAKCIPIFLQRLTVSPTLPIA